MSCWGQIFGSFSAARRFVLPGIAGLCVLCASAVISFAVDEKTPASGLQWRLLPQTQIVVVPEGRRAQDVEVYLTCIASSASEKAVRFLPRGTPFDDQATDAFTAVGSSGTGVASIASAGQAAARAASREDFLTIEPGKAITRAVRLPLDFTQPGVYAVCASAHRDPGDLAIYYPGDAAAQAQNADNVWTGAAVSNAVIVNVVRPGRKQAALETKPSRTPWASTPNATVKVSPRDLQLQLALDTKISIEFDLPTDLKEVVASINEMIKAQTGIQDPIMLDPRVVATEPRQVTINRHEESVRNVLRIILLQASSDQEITNNSALDFYANRDLGVIYVSNPTRLVALKVRDKELRIYDIRDLLALFPVGSGQH